MYCRPALCVLIYSHIVLIKSLRRKIFIKSLFKPLAQVFIFNSF